MYHSKYGEVVGSAGSVNVAVFESPPLKFMSVFSLIQVPTLSQQNKEWHKKATRNQ